MNKKKWMPVSLGFLAALVPTSAFAAEASNITIQSVEFKGMDAPKTTEDMAKVYSKAEVEVTYSNGKKQSYPLTYKELFKSTDTFKMGDKEMQAGTPIDVKGNPIMDTSIPDKPVPFVSDAPDSNSLLMKVDGQASDEWFMVSHYEYQTQNHAGKSAYGYVPASMSVTTLKQDPKTGELKTKQVNKVDFSDVNGLWIPCNGSLSPWNTHLGSEEYEPDARKFEEANQKGLPDPTNVKAFAKNYFGDETKANPYYYGYVPEITVHADGSTKAVKHYSNGRISRELSVVLPDEKTMLMGDDGANTMLFMFVSDRPKDLTSGSLYAAKWNQTSDQNGGAANLEWIKLGHASDEEVKALIDSGIQFSDIFETSDQPAPGFTAIKTYQGEEYLKLKPGMEKAAAFLESRRYGAILGATSEFNKMEGVAVNQKDKKAYIAMSNLSKGMEDSKGKDEADHIKLPKVNAGAVYELPLAPNQKDHSGNEVASTLTPSSMKALVVGKDTKTDEYGNTADVNNIANPDNLSFSDATNTLFIGEDSSQHTNNFVWAYNVDTKKLSRILSVPAGAEATGLKVADDRGGFSYIMSNFQHPGDDLADRKGITAVNQKDVISLIDQTYGVNKGGAVGYIAGLPSFTTVPASIARPMFTDVPNSHWAYEMISNLHEKELIQGVDNEHFEPERTITRAEFVQMIVKALDLKASKPLAFKDVPEWAKDAVAAAHESGIVTGRGGDTFDPSAPITREEMATIMMRGYKVKTGKTYEPKQPMPFTDQNQVSSWANESIKSAVELNLLKGYDDGSFKPKKAATRAESAKVVYQLINQQ